MFPQIFEYTLSLNISFTSFIAEVKNFWFLSIRGVDMTLYTRTVLVNTHALMHFHKQITQEVILTIQNTNNNNKIPKIIN